MLELLQLTQLSGYKQWRPSVWQQTSEGPAVLVPMFTSCHHNFSLFSCFKSGDKLKYKMQESGARYKKKWRQTSTTQVALQFQKYIVIKCDANFNILLNGLKIE